MRYNTAKVIDMAQFDSEKITLMKGQSLMEALKKALENKGLADRMDSDSGIFIIDDVTVKSINGDEVLIEVNYEYGG